MTLTFQYNNQVMQDGHGAQALRIVVLYGLSKYFRCNFLNEPIITKQEQFASNIESMSELDEFTKKVNDFFNLLCFIFTSSRHSKNKSKWSKSNSVE